MSTYTQKSRNGMYELTDAARAELLFSKYCNEDLSPTTISQRTWSTYHITALWVGLAVCIPSFTIASALVGLGLSPWMSVFNVVLGNIIMLIPIQLNSHVGTKYGIPFPVFCRLSFGSVGAHIPSLSRAFTACGWNALQCWVGGAAVGSMIAVFSSPFSRWDGARYAGFFIFLFLTWLLTVKGSECIKWMETIGGTIEIILAAALFIYSVYIAYAAGYNFGDVIQATADQSKIDDNGGFWYIFLGGLTANIAFWSAMALSIPDFSRYARTQKSQFKGQLYGMPITMAACAFIGAFFAQSTKLVQGTASFDPTALLEWITNPFLAFIIALGILIATITTTTAANVVASANAFSNISPQRINFAKGVTITCILTILFLPWRMFGDGGVYIFDWLKVYSEILAPVAAIFIADYYVVKKRNIDVMALFQGKEGRYWYRNGWNIKAIIAWVCGIILPALGNLNITPLKWIAANGYVFAFFVAFFLYIILMKSETTSFISKEEEAAMTER